MQLAAGWVWCYNLDMKAIVILILWGAFCGGAANCAALEEEKIEELKQERSLAAKLLQKGVLVAQVPLKGVRGLGEGCEFLTAKEHPWSDVERRRLFVGPLLWVKVVSAREAFVLQQNLESLELARVHISNSVKPTIFFRVRHKEKGSDSIECLPSDKVLKSFYRMSWPLYCALEVLPLYDGVWADLKKGASKEGRRALFITEDSLQCLSGGAYEDPNVTFYKVISGLTPYKDYFSIECTPSVKRCQSFFNYLSGFLGHLEEFLNINLVAAAADEEELGVEWTSAKKHLDGMLGVCQVCGYAVGADLCLVEPGVKAEKKEGAKKSEDSSGFGLTGLAGVQFFCGELAVKFLQMDMIMSSVCEIWFDKGFGSEWDTFALQMFELFRSSREFFERGRPFFEEAQRTFSDRFFGVDGSEKKEVVNLQKMPMKLKVRSHKSKVRQFSEMVNITSRESSRSLFRSESAGSLAEEKVGGLVCHVIKLDSLEPRDLCGDGHIMQTSLNRLEGLAELLCEPDQTILDPKGSALLF